ncbi:MAG: serine hydrolase, partial [Eubacteriales bacterium]|nr:serine hydrolase [Eubacteriales bacterium]
MGRKLIEAVLILVCAAAGSLLWSGCAKTESMGSGAAALSSAEEAAADLDTIEGEAEEAAVDLDTLDIIESETETGSEGRTAQETDIPAGEGSTKESKEGMRMQTAATRSPATEALEKRLRERLENLGGKWSLYVYRLDTDEEISINAEEPMISASLIKLFVAGCYLEKVEKGEISDDYQDQLYYMLSASDNGSTNLLIDVLGMDQINAFMEKHGYKAGKLNRRMLEKNGTENYTSAKDCGRVLRKVYRKTYVNEEASGRILNAMLNQIERNRQKIPAGVPEGIETANKTGELFTVDSDGVSVNVQNDAAIIFGPGHDYVMTVMSSVPSAGEAQLHREIASLSAEVYEAIFSGESLEEDVPAEEAVEEAAA